MTAIFANCKTALTTNPVKNLPKNCTTENVANASMVAIAVIGVLAALSLATSSAVVGWGAVGFGGVAAAGVGYGVYKNVNTKAKESYFKNHKVELLVKSLVIAGVIAVGVLGGIGMISPQIVGFALVGAVALRVFYSLADSYCLNPANPKKAKH